MYYLTVEKIISKINVLFDSGKNIIQICNQLIYRITDIIVNYYLSNNKSLDFDVEKLESLANLLNEKMFELKRSEHPNIYFEIMILNFLKKVPVEKIIETNEVKSVENVENEEKNIPVVEKPKVEKSKKEQTIVENKNLSSAKLEDKDLSFLYEINNVRINNTFAEASKDELIKNKNLFSKFSDFTFDTKIGYLVCDIMDGTLRAASSRNVIISYDYDMAVKQNIEHIEKLQDVYNKITGLDVNLALVTEKKWEKIKEEYIKNKKNGILYEYKDELSVSRDKDDVKTKDSDSASVLEMLSEVVEYE